jgi:fructoselysine-6-P-deglycase FrlB-like protein
LIKIKKNKYSMQKKSSIAIFLAATSALAISTSETNSLNAEENDLGGLKEWNTDMPLEADFVLDSDAQKIADEAAKSSMCIPIGEGENCW